MNFPSVTECLLILTALCFLELLTAGVLRWSRAQLQKSLGRQVGQPMETLSPNQLNAAISETANAFSQTIWAKIELIIMAYHLPACLAMALVRKTRRGSSLAFYFGFTVMFWFIVVSVVVEVTKLMIGTRWP
jgi:hypothetical protein